MAALCVSRDLDHLTSFCNKSAERLYGWAFDEVAESSIATLLYEESVP